MTQLSALNVRINGDATGLKAALDTGRVGLQRLGATAVRTQSGVARMTGAFARLGNMSGSVRAKIQQVGFQVQDIAVQMAAGTRATTVFAQQGSQILSVFGPMGAILGAVAAVSLPLLGAAFFNASEKALDLEDAIKALGDRAVEAEQKLALLRTGLNSTEELIVQQEIDRLLQRRAGIVSNLNGLQQAVRAQQEREVEAIDRQVSSLQSKLSTLRQNTAELERVQQSAQNFRQSVDHAFGRLVFRVGEVQAKFQAFADRIVKSNRQAGALSKEIGTAATQALVLAGVDITSPISNAAKEAAKLAAQLNISLNAALSLQNLQGSKEYSGRGEDPRKFENGGSPSGNNPLGLPATGGGGGGPVENPLIAELEAVRTSLLSQEEAQIESYQRQQETLQQALEQRLLTQQEYSGLMEQAQERHGNAMRQIDALRYGTGLQRTKAFLGDMETAFATGSEDMLRISKSFGAAQALISAWEGAANALTLPFPHNMAAFAKVLATGKGAVQAIKSVTPGGGGFAAAGGGAAVPALAAAPPAPLEARVTGFTADQFFRGDMVPELFNRLQDEAGDRGLRLTFT